MVKTRSVLFYRADHSILLNGVTLNNSCLGGWGVVVLGQHCACILSMHTVFDKKRMYYKIMVCCKMHFFLTIGMLLLLRNIKNALKMFKFLYSNYDSKLILLSDVMKKKVVSKYFSCRSRDCSLMKA